MPLVLVGEVVSGGLLAQDITTLSVEAEATHLPTEIQIAIGDLEIGQHLSAGDLVLPEGTTLVTDPEALVIAINEAPTAEQLEGETAEAATVEAEPEAEAE